MFYLGRGQTIRAWAKYLNSGQIKRARGVYLGGGNNQGRGVSVPSTKQKRRADRIRYAGRGIRQAGHNNTNAGEGVSNRNGKAGVASKKISVQNPQKRFGLAESFGSQKIFGKNFGKLKKGFVSIGRIFGVSGKNLSGVRLFGCIYW